MIQRNFVALDKTSLPLLYKSVVRPILENGNVVSHPRFKSDETTLENVQRRATKLVVVRYLEKDPYEERMRKLNISSLHYRKTTRGYDRMLQVSEGNIQYIIFYVDAKL